MSEKSGPKIGLYTPTSTSRATTATPGRKAPAKPSKGQINRYTLPGKTAALGDRPPPDNKEGAKTASLGFNISIPAVLSPVPGMLAAFAINKADFEPKMSPWYLDQPGPQSISEQYCVQIQTCWEGPRQKMPQKSQLEIRNQAAAGIGGSAKAPTKTVPLPRSVASLKIAHMDLCAHMKGQQGLAGEIQVKKGYAILNGRLSPPCKMIEILSYSHQV
jgi:hypothetical protein